MYILAQRSNTVISSPKPKAQHKSGPSSVRSSKIINIELVSDAKWSILIKFYVKLIWSGRVFEQVGRYL